MAGVNDDGFDEQGSDEGIDDAVREREFRAAQRKPGPEKPGGAQGALAVRQEIKDVQSLVKLLKIGSAATVVGLVITAFVMLWQSFFGNLLKGSILPSDKLADWEYPIAGVLWAAIIVASLLLFLLVAMIMSIQ